MDSTELNAALLIKGLESKIVGGNVEVDTTDENVSEVFSIVGDLLGKATYNLRHRDDTLRITLS